MNISSIGNIADITKNAAGISSATSNDKTSAFDDIFQAAVGMINQTNNYSNAAEQAETAYATGLNDSVADLMVAQTKANLSLQYTVAIRNNALEAYNQIMNLQF